MTRYFFNIHRQSALCLDTEGQEFPTIAEAQVAAIAALCEIAGESLKAADPIEVRAIEVADPTGKVVRTIAMTDAVLGLLPDHQPAKS